MSANTLLDRSRPGDDLRQVFRRVPQPVAVVTGLSPAGAPVGMTVSSVTAASLAPPLVLFCPAVTSPTWAAMRARGWYAVNILGRQQGDLAAWFARPGDRFLGVDTVRADAGLPTLADALAVLVCDIHSEYPAGDHTVVLGHVHAICARREGTGLDTVTFSSPMTPRSSSTRPGSWPCSR